MKIKNDPIEQQAAVIRERQNKLTDLQVKLAQLQSHINQDNTRDVLMYEILLGLWTVITQEECLRAESLAMMDIMTEHLFGKK